MYLLSLLFDPKHQTLRLRAAWFIYLSVLIFGSIPGARTEVGEYAGGFFLHFTTYGCIALLLFTGMRASPAGRAMRTFLLIAAMGACDEFLQSFLPYRRGALTDWYVDMAAGLFVCSMLWLLSPRLAALQAAQRGE